MKINVAAITQLLHKNGWNKSQFAKELGVCRATVSRLVHEQREPGGKFIGAFIKRFPNEPLNKYFLPNV